MIDSHIAADGTVSIFGSGFRILGLGANWRGKPRNWSLQGTYTCQRGRSMGEITGTDFLAFAESPTINLAEILLPQPHFGQAVATKADLPVLRRFSEKVTLHLGPKAADICMLKRGETYAIAPGGCATVCIHHPGDTLNGIAPIWVAAHVGRDNLYDAAEVFDMRSSALQHESVVFAMVEPFARLLKSMERLMVEAIIAFAIPSHKFEHPLENNSGADKNRRVCEALRKWGGVQCWSHATKGKLCSIDLETIITSQLVACGIPRENVRHAGSTFAGRPELWHTTRGPEENRRKRNLVLVTAI